MDVVATEARGRGRPRQFDEDEVLDALVQLFWSRGFDDASLNEIVEAAGLNKSSLYNAFGSKDEVFFAVLDRYMDFRSAMLAEMFDGEGGLDLVLGFLQVVRAELASDTGCRGCLAVNASTELGMRDERVAAMADRYRHQIADGVRGPLVRAADAGEIDAGLVDAYVDMVVAFCISLSVAARSGAATEELERQIDSLEQLIGSWRLA